MSVTAEFVIGQEQFALGAATADAPGVTVELDRILPIGTPGVPYVWVSGGDFDEFERVVSASSLIETVTAIEQSPDAALYRIEWMPDASSLLQELADANVSILQCYRENEQWFFRLRFDDHDDLVEFHSYCSAKDVTYTLTRVYPDGEREGDQLAFGLSQQAFDTLVLAVERGYFAVPRGVKLEELGDELGITQQATSERVRRAVDQVLRTVLLGPRADG